MPNTLEENVNRVKAAASAISAAITAKGGTVTSGDGLEDFASDIATIPSGDSAKIINNIRCLPLTNHLIMSSWQSKTWSGLTNFNSSAIWTDGENIYYSNGSDQYILDKSTSTWTTKTWSGIANTFGTSIWTDGNDIYYSNAEAQYILDKSTSTWNRKTWSGITNFYGYSIWTDGEYIYHSNAASQYILDKSTSTWTTKTWSGLTNFNGNRIWTDGENIYYSNDTAQYILEIKTNLNKLTSVRTILFNQ